MVHILHKTDSLIIEILKYQSILRRAIDLKLLVNYYNWLDDLGARFPCGIHRSDIARRVNYILYTSYKPGLPDAA